MANGIELPACNPIKLGLALNFSVFHYEVMKNQAQAISLADTALQEALDRIDELEEDEADPVLEDDLAEAEDADADVSFADEFRAGGFASYNATAADETHAREYGLKPPDIPANLSREADQ